MMLDHFERKMGSRFQYSFGDEHRMEYNATSWPSAAHSAVYKDQKDYRSKVEKALGGIELHGITTEELDR
jgi:hypothetical protein